MLLHLSSDEEVELDAADAVRPNNAGSGIETRASSVPFGQPATHSICADTSTQPSDAHLEPRPSHTLHADVGSSSSEHSLYTASDSNPTCSTPTSSSAITVVRLDEYIARLQARGYGLPNVTLPCTASAPPHAHPPAPAAAQAQAQAPSPAQAFARPASPSSNSAPPVLDTRDADVRKTLYGDQAQPSLRLVSRHGRNAWSHASRAASADVDTTFHSLPCQDRITCRAHPAVSDLVAPPSYAISDRSLRHAAHSSGGGGSSNSGSMIADGEGAPDNPTLLHTAHHRRNEPMLAEHIMPDDILRVSNFFGGVRFKPHVWANLRVCLRFGADAGRRRTFATRGDRLLKLLVSSAPDILDENRELLDGSFKPPTKLIETDAELGRWAQSHMRDLTTGHLAGDEVRAYAGLFKGVCYFVYRSVGESETARALKHVGLGTDPTA